MPLEKRDPASGGLLQPPPVPPPASSSHISQSAPPLWPLTAPPNGSRLPGGSVYRWFGSVVGLPSASTRQSGGISRPLLRATLTLPSAVAEVAKSRITGAAPGTGIPIAIGLVVPRPSRPPWGTTRSG